MTKMNFIYSSAVIILITVNFFSSGCYSNRIRASENPRFRENEMKSTREAQFAEVFQKAIHIARRRLADHDPKKDPLKRSSLEDVIEILAKQKQVVLTQGVEVYEGQYGPMKHLIDIGEPMDSELSDAVYEIEIYYKQNYIARMTKEEKLAGRLQNAIELAEGGLTDHDSDTEYFTKGQLRELISLLSERRKEALSGQVEPYKAENYEFIKTLINRGVPVDSAVIYWLQDADAFHRENF